MDRDLHDERFDSVTIANQAARPTGSNRPECAAVITTDRSVPETADRLRSDDRSIYELRDKSYRLNDLEARMLRDIGAFRAIEKTDLLHHIYKQDHAAFDRDLRHLHRHNLLRIVGPKGSTTKYIVLTKTAKQLAEKHLRTNPRQQLYHGAAKIRELKHDATLYRLYQKVAKEMEQRGERPLRVVLDYELKRSVNKARAKTKELPWQERQQKIGEIAHQHKLRVINGKIPLPDLRIEYERADGDADVRDLEYITEHYRARSFTEKAAAGFTLYGSEKHGRSPWGPDLIGGLV